jgi:hypothetical protein
MEEVIPSQGAIKRSSSSLIPSIRATAGDAKKGEGWPITFRHLGKNGYELTLYAMNQAARKKWLEKIDNSQNKLRSRADFFNTSCISDGFFTATNHINCAAPFGESQIPRAQNDGISLLLTYISDGSRKLLVGTDNGIYVLDRRAKGAAPKRVIEVPNVTQMEVLEEYQLFIVLSNKSLLSYPLSALDPNEPALSRRPKKIQSHCNFFKASICLGRHLVCAARSSGMSTRIQVYEPNDAMAKTKKQKGLGKMFGSQDELRPFKEFYIPAESTSLHFLKSKLCVACSKGFEVLSLETLEAQSLLDQADTSLDFVARREGVRPIHIERLDGEFLVNYSEFSFFVNRHGWRAKPEWRIDWEGAPQSFALSYPWLLAFEQNFIELRDIESGAVHIVPHKNIRMLHSSTNEVSSIPPALVSHLSVGGGVLDDDRVLTSPCVRLSLRTRTRGARMPSRRLTSGRHHLGVRSSLRRRILRKAKRTSTAKGPRLPWGIRQIFCALARIWGEEGTLPTWVAPRRRTITGLKTVCCSDLMGDGHEISPHVSVLFSNSSRLFFSSLSLLFHLFFRFLVFSPRSSI